MSDTTSGTTGGTTADRSFDCDRAQASLHPPEATRAADQGHHCPERERKLVLVVAVIASAMGFIDSTVVSIAIPAMRESLDASLAQAQWVQNAYLLTLSALILVGGAAGDRFGVRDTFMAGIAAFAVASVLCALAPTAELLIGARFLKGAAAAFMVPLSLALIAKNHPADTRGRAIGIWAAASGVTTAIGPLAGGWLLSVGDAEVWRWIFWINLPLALPVLWMLSRVPRDAPRGDGGVPDLAGAALVTLALGLLALGLTGLGSGGGAAMSGANILLALAGAGTFALFVLWERRASTPMVELHLFRSRAFAGANALTFVLYFAMGGVLFFLPMAMVGGWGLSEAAVGTVFLPFTAVMAVLSGPAGAYAGRHGPRGPIALGALVVALAFGWLALSFGSRSLAWSVYPAMAVLGVGMGLAVSPLSAAIMGAVDDEHSGEASGINNAVSRMAGLMAVAALGVLVALVFGAAGPEAASFGEPGMAADEAFASASDRAFAALAWTCAALAALAAWLGWITQEAR